MRIHAVFEVADLLLINKHFEIAGIGEINLCCEKRCAADAPVFLGGHIRERHREKRAADAIANGCHMVFTGERLDFIKRRINAFADIILKALLRLPLIRVDPRNTKDSQSLRNSPANKRFFSVQIENIELIDPWRHNKERSLKDCFCHRRILNELDQIIAKNDLAGRCREIHADFETARCALP